MLFNKRILFLFIFFFSLFSIGYSLDFFTTDNTGSYRWNLGTFNGVQDNTNNISLNVSPIIEPLPDNGANDWVNMTGNVLLMHMDESSGTIVDSSGQGNNGTQSGGVTYASTGQVDTALSFDGTDDSISISDDNSLDLSTISIAAWIYPHSKSGTNSEEFILSKRSGVPEVNYQFVLGPYGTATSYLSFVYYNGGWLVYNTDVEVPINTWSHIAVSFTGSEVNLYIDGSLSKQHTGLTLPLISNSAALLIGSFSTDFFDGEIDELAIWNRTLSATEIQEIYDNQKGAFTSSGTYTSQVFSDSSYLSFDDIEWNSTQFISSSSQTDFEDTFTSGPDTTKWTETGGQWTISSGRGYANNCDPPGDDLDSDGTSYSSGIDLSSASEATLSYDYETSSLDDASECLLVYVDDGSTGWTLVNSYCGTSNHLGSASVNLKDYISLTSTVKVRFHCDSSGTGDHVYIDNVKINSSSIENAIVSIQARTSEDNVIWSSWSNNLSNPSGSINSYSKFIQYQALFSTNSASLIPYLNWINLSYTDVNDKPTVTLSSPSNLANSEDFNNTNFLCTVYDYESGLVNLSGYLYDFNDNKYLIYNKSSSGQNDNINIYRNIMSIVGLDNQTQYLTKPFKWNCLVYDNSYSYGFYNSINHSFSNWDLGTYGGTELNENLSLQMKTLTDNEKDLPDNAANDWIDMSGNVLLYHLDESSGTISDTSGQGNNGTQSGGVNYSSTGKLNSALSFDNVDDIINAGSGSSLDINGDITISAWIYPTGWGESSGNGFGRIIDKNTYSLYLHETTAADYNDYSLVFALDDSATTYVVNSPVSSITLNSWNHIVASYDGTTMRLYIGGVEPTLSYPYGSFTGTFDDNSADTLYIGNRADTARTFDGTIDELSIWNRTLSSTEIQEIYQHQKGTYASSSNYTSEIIDVDAFISLDSLSWDSDTNINSSVKIQARTSDDNISWSPWTSNLVNPSTSLDNYARYFQYRTFLSTNDSDYTPILNWVNLTYEKLLHVTLNSPSNNTNNLDFSSVIFNCSVINYKGHALNNVTIYSDISGIWEPLTTGNLSGLSDSYQTTLNLYNYADTKRVFINGGFNWNCLATDIMSNSAFSYNNYTYSSWDLGTYNNTKVGLSQNNLYLNSTNWGNGDWSYYKEINITENSGSSLSNFEVSISIDTQSLISSNYMKSDCSDIKFIDSSDNQLDYWIEKGCNSTNTEIWVELVSLSPSSTETIKMFYGNPSATSQSSGDNTFNFFDDFLGSSLNTSKWTEVNGGGTASITIASSNLEARGDGSNRAYVRTNSQFSAPYVITSKAKKSENIEISSHWDGLIGGTYDELNNGYKFVYRSWLATPEYSLDEYVANVLASLDNYVITEDTNYHMFDLYLNSAGTTINIYRNDTQILTSTDTTRTSGYIGLSGRENPSGLNSYYDFIFVRDFASTEPSYVLGVQKNNSLATGSFTSKIFYTGMNVSIDNITWNSANNSNSNLSVQFRSSPDNNTWTSWSSDLNNPSNLLSNGTLYFQYMVIFRSSLGLSYPYLSNIKIFYTPNPDVVYIYPTPINESKVALDNLTIKFQSTYTNITNCTVNINDIPYEMNLVGKTCSYTLTNLASKKLTYNFTGYYNGTNSVGSMSFIFFPNEKQVKGVSGFGLGSVVLYLVLIFLGGLYRRK